MADLFGGGEEAASDCAITENEVACDEVNGLASVVSLVCSIKR